VPTALRVTWTEGSRQSLLMRLSLSLLSSSSSLSVPAHACGLVRVHVLGGVQCVDTRVAAGGLRLQDRWAVR